MTLWLVGSVLSLVALCIAAFSLHYSLTQASNAEEWAVQTTWKLSTCKVLAVGVMCTEKDEASTCGGYGADNGTHDENGVLVFDYREMAACPGSFWCAVDGDLCECYGEVTYAAELFNGKNYTIADGDRRFTHRVSGSITCGLDKSGQPYEDPAPYMMKHCWCTPVKILDILGRGDADLSSPAMCANKANAVWNRVIDVEGGSDATGEIARRLTGAAPAEDGAFRGSLTSELRVADGADDGFGDVASDVEVYGDSEDLEELDDEEEGETRRLAPVVTSPRRRRTYTYTPWALVELPPEQAVDPGVGDIGALPGTMSPKSTITCAYEFGNPEASWGQYETDGPSPWIFNHADEAQTKVENWAKGERKCFVKSVGKASSDDCAVSMEPLSALEKRAQGQVNASWIGVILASVMSVCCIGAFLFEVLSSMMIGGKDERALISKFDSDSDSDSS